MVKRAIKSGDIRRDLDPFDLLRALIGVSNVASTPDWQRSARRLVDILSPVRGRSNRAQEFYSRMVGSSDLSPESACRHSYRAVVLVAEAKSPVARKSAGAD
jgi:hypothetical protein